MPKNTLAPHRPAESGRITLAAVLFALAFLLGLWNLAALAAPQTRTAVYQVLEAQKIAPDAYPAWFRIHCGVTVFTVLGCGCMTAALVLTVLHREDRGLAILSELLPVLRQGLRILRLFLIGLFIFKFVRYSLRCIGINGGSFLFYGMALFEGLLFTLAMLAFRWMLRFLDGAAGSACAVRYTLASGEPDPGAIHPGTVTGLCALAVIQLILGYLYRWSCLMLFMELALAVGYFLTGRWLRHYRSAMEWQKLRNS